MTRFGLEIRISVIPWAKEAKCGRRASGRWQEEQMDLSPALRPDGAPRSSALHFQLILAHGHLFTHTP